MSSDITAAPREPPTTRENRRHHNGRQAGARLGPVRCRAGPLPFASRLARCSNWPRRAAART
eukprot:6626220-Lingulodinium_polyedra.AAC.1